MYAELSSTRCWNLASTTSPPNSTPDEIFSSFAAVAAFMTQTTQFAITTFMTLAGVWRNNYRRMHTIVHISAGATRATLTFSEAGLLGYAFSLKGVDVYTTNDQSVTGPCTFAVVQMLGLL
jgi:hypothetical protein